MAREFNNGDKRGELFVGIPGLMAMGAEISGAMTKRVKGTRRAIMLADVKTAFLHGDARRSLYVELPHEDPFLVDTLASLSVPCMEHETLQ